MEYLYCMDDTPYKLMTPLSSSIINYQNKLNYGQAVDELKGLGTHQSQKNIDIILFIY